jgi:hypothetical protein
MANQQLHIPQGIKDKFANDEKITNPNEVVPALLARVDELVALYAGNGMQAFWSTGDLQALHVICMNHLLSSIDSDAAIDDVEMNEILYSKLQDILCVWSSCKKRAQFDESLSNVSSLPSQAIHNLLNVLLVAETLLDEPENSPHVITGDDQQLYRIIQFAKQNQSREGYARARFKMAAQELSKPKAAKPKIQEQPIIQAPAPSPAPVRAPSPSPVTLPPPSQKPQVPLFQKDPVNVFDVNKQSPKSFSFSNFIKRSQR